MWRALQIKSIQHRNIDLQRHYLPYHTNTYAMSCSCMIRVCISLFFLPHAIISTSLWAGQWLHLMNTYSEAVPHLPVPSCDSIWRVDLSQLLTQLHKLSYVPPENWVSKFCTVHQYTPNAVLALQSLGTRLNSSLYYVMLIAYFYIQIQFVMSSCHFWSTTF